MTRRVFAPVFVVAAAVLVAGLACAVPRREPEELPAATAQAATLAPQGDPTGDAIEAVFDQLEASSEAEAAELQDLP